MSAGSQSISMPVRKPTVKAVLVGSAAQRAASVAASTWRSAMRA